MDPIRTAITRPVTVAVGIILVVMFGLIGFNAVPVQLTPTVERPKITVTTNWPGRSPEEIVDEIVKKQEEQLKNVDNLEKMTSTSQQGQGSVVLEFYIGSNIPRALQEVSDSLRQVEAVPDDADEPVITVGEDETSKAIAWIIIDVDPDQAHKHPDFDIQTLYTALDERVKPFLERTGGVAEVNIYGGRERELRVEVDTTRLAQFGLNHLDLINAIRGENLDVSAGTSYESKREYRVRVLGKFEEPEDALDTIIAYREAGPVYLKDVAEVSVGHEKRRGFVRSMEHPAIAMNVIQQTGTNVMEVMAGVRERIDEIRADILPRLDPQVGPDLRIRQVYDETIYIDSAIGLVTQNLWVGGILAGIILLLFLRSFVATGVVALAIPVSVMGTFLVLLALGRTLNVISLAGLAFAVGMVVDNAIVVLENIFRHRQMGKTPARAAYDGGREVIGAIVAATLTTVAVFIPILTIQQEAGQLFRDIALAIVASVSLSLLVSITVIPAATAKFLGHAGEKHKGIRGAFENLFGIVPALAWFSHWIADAIYWLMTGWRGWTVRPALIIVMTVASLAGAWALKPPLDYLPAGNRNLVFGGLLVPPGYSIDQLEATAERVEATMHPYLDTALEAEGRTVEDLAPIPRRGFGGNQPDPYQPVSVDNFFVGAFGGSMFAGATSSNPEVVIPVGQLLSNAFGTVPDAYGGASQTSLFGRGVGSGGSIDIEIMGPDLAEVKAAATSIFDKLIRDESYGPQRVRPAPGNFNVAQQEVRARITPMARELGMTTEGVGTAVRALFDGAYAGDFDDQGQTIDIRLVPRGGRLENKEDAAGIPVATPTGSIVSLDQIIAFEPGLAPQEIRRIEELPSVTIGVTPPEGEPIELVMNDIRERFVKPLQEGGQLSKAMRVRLEGTAAQLDEVQVALLGERESDAPIYRLDQRWESWNIWRRVAAVGAALLLGASLILAGVNSLRAITKSDTRLLYGAAGAVVLGGTLSAIFLAVIAEPSLLTARFIWATIVVYLLMAALFESFSYPFVIMFSVPLALVGGFAGLAIVHHYTMANPVLSTQNLDVLTMLGFIILVGVVVNNAILIVHQSLNLMAGNAEVVEKDGTTSRGKRYEPLRAVSLAVSTRIRPVFMSTMTSVGGMLPLVLFPGAGSELYRGLGSVVVGGLLVATVFTLVLVPMVFSISLQMIQGVRAGFGLSTDIGVVESEDIDKQLTDPNPTGDQDQDEQTSTTPKPAQPQTPAREPVRSDKPNRGDI